MGFWRQIGEYLFIKRKDPNAPSNTNIKLMHGMNRISLLLFIICILIMLWRLLIKK